MTIYNINYSIGWASSGIEYAQFYRAKMLREQKESLKFVFLDFMTRENIQTLTSHMGYYDHEIIWIYQYFTDIKIAPTTYTINNLIDTLDMKITRREENKKIVKLFSETNQTYVTCFLKEQGKPYVDRAEFVSRGKLIRKDFYTYTRTFSEYYAPHENRAKVYMRQFYNEDGSIAYNEYLNNNGQLYMFKDQIFYSKEEFVAYFMKCLHLTSRDIVLIDRSKGMAQPVIQNKGESQLGVVIHAEHYSENSTTDDYILWNNYYEYVFSHSREIDFYIAATDRQKAVLSHQFNQYYGNLPKIYTVPVGSIHDVIVPDSRKPYSVITASRLASEKHIDWLVKAVVKAKQSIPDLIFDIYGEGAERNMLQKLIDENEANDYIKLLGHVKLQDVYANYKLFFAGSTSEGFGLTLMEAVGSGLGMIGFDVNYGNTTFISHHENGYLIPFDKSHQSEQEIVDNLANAVVQFFKNDTSSFHEKSYELAEQYKTDNIKQKWFHLIEEVLHD